MNSTKRNGLHAANGKPTENTNQLWHSKTVAEFGRTFAREFLYGCLAYGLVCYALWMAGAFIRLHQGLNL